MTGELYADVRCPSCSSLIRLGIDDQALNCVVCGSEHEISGHLCPHCLTFHDELASNCLTCGSALTRICTNCQHTNWSGSDICSNCGQQSDIFVSLSSSAQEATVNRLSRQMEQASDLKEEEELSSKKRMAELIAIEEARQAELRQRLAKQKRQERQFLMVVFGSILVFLLILMIAALLSTVN